MKKSIVTTFILLCLSFGNEILGQQLEVEVNPNWLKSVT